VHGTQYELRVLLGGECDLILHRHSLWEAIPGFWSTCMMPVFDPHNAAFAGRNSQSYCDLGACLGTK
jgi:hypothetical protein